MDFHPNILRFYGISKLEADLVSQMNKYLLVIEYADSGSLNSYLKENFDKLEWNDKFRLALQLFIMKELSIVIWYYKNL